MYVVSGRWDSAIRQGATYKTVIDIYYNSISPALTNLEVSKWSMQVDRKSDIRRSATLTLENLDLFEAWTGGTSFEPYGSEVVIRTGVVYAPGDEELVPLGRFDIKELSWSEPGPAMTLSLVDRARRVQRRNYAFPVSRGGWSATAVIGAIVQDATPTATLLGDSDIADIRFPGGTVYKGNTLDICRSTAASIGCEFFYDVNGNARIAKVPFVDPLLTNSQSDWVVDVGANGVMISADRKVSREETFNSVTVIGASATDDTAQPYTIAQDLSPASPTYYYGNFGKADKIIERQELTTESDCYIVAQAELVKTLGLARTLDSKFLSNPALDAGDIILAIYPDGMKELHVIDSLSLDSSGGMSMSTRIQVIG